MAGIMQMLGTAWPMRVNAQGGIAEAAGQETVRLAVLAILGTHPGERLMRPTFGCPLRDLVFSPNSQATANLARFHVVDALTRWEPRIALETVRVANQEDGDGSSLLIEVSYRIRTTGAAASVAFRLPLS